MGAVLWCAWLAAAAGFATLQHRYCSRTDVVTAAAVYACGVLSIVTLLAVPLDISAAQHDECILSALLNGTATCGPVGLTYTTPESRHALWIAVYWALFVLGWLAVPFLQAYVVSGAFCASRRVAYALRINAVAYGMSLAIVVVLGLYVKLASHAESWDAVAALLMALSNAVGLLAAVVLLGVGLVDTPLALWAVSSLHARIKRVHRRAPFVHDSVISAEAQLREVCDAVSALSETPGIASEYAVEIASLRSRAFFCDRGLLGSPQPSVHAAAAGQRVLPGQRGDVRSGASNQDSNMQRRSGENDYLYHSRNWQSSSQALLERLENLSYRLEDAAARLERERWEWRKLQAEASVCTFAEDETSKWALRAAAVATGLASVSIACAQLLVPFGGSSVLRSVLSVFSGSPVALDVACLVLLTYAWVCVARPLHDMPLLRPHFRIVAGGHTDAKSMLFFASMHTRLAPALAYNFLTLVERAGVDATQFARVMGLQDIVPLLGRRVAFAVPVVLGAVLFVTMYVRLVRPMMRLSEVIDAQVMSSRAYTALVSSEESAARDVDREREGRMLLSRPLPRATFSVESV